MADMLVRLYDLPPLQPALQPLEDRGIRVRRLAPYEQSATLAWLRAHFPGWAAEVEVAFTRRPVTCFGALRGQRVLGFAAYDATCLNFFGPTGVLERERGGGIGRALLLATLHAQHEQGYAYAIIGGVGPAEFYRRLVDAQPIANSTPGIYVQ